MNYGELSTALQDYMETSEAKFITHIPDFLRAAEDAIFSAIEGPMFWKASDTTTMVDGTFSYTLPDGVIDVLGIRLCEDIPGDMDTGGPFRYLNRRDVDFLFEAYPGTAATLKKGIPKHYSVASVAVNSDEVNMVIRMGPVPDAAYKTSIEYYGKATTDSITDGGDSKKTWLSITYPSTLLYGALIDAAIFQKSEMEVKQTINEAFNQGMALLTNFAEARQSTDTFSDTGKDEVG